MKFDIWVFLLGFLLVLFLRLAYVSGASRDIGAVLISMCMIAVVVWLLRIEWKTAARKELR